MPAEVSTVSGSFSGPSGLAADAGGNVYVADQQSHTVIRISTLGTVGTYAGSGTGGNADNASPLLATFQVPAGVAADAAGNVYVADQGGNRIRKIAANSGPVTTVAGSGASGNADHATDPLQATFSGPSGVAVDTSGNLYVADTSNGSVRKISATVVTTLATGFSNPFGIVVDGSGTVYVADSGHLPSRRSPVAGRCRWWLGAHKVRPMVRGRPPSSTIRTV